MGRCGVFVEEEEESSGAASRKTTQVSCGYEGHVVRNGAGVEWQR